MATHHIAEAQNVYVCQEQSSMAVSLNVLNAAGNLTLNGGSSSGTNSRALGTGRCIM